MRGAKVEKCFSRKELNDRAQVAAIDSTPIRFYIRTAQLLYRQVSASRISFRSELLVHAEP